MAKCALGCRNVHVVSVQCTIIIRDRSQHYDTTSETTEVFSENMGLYTCSCILCACTAYFVFRTFNIMTYRKILSLLISCYLLTITLILYFSIETRLTLLEYCSRCLMAVIVMMMRVMMSLILKRCIKA